MPGTIHADSDGSGCTGGSNSNVYIGAQSERHRGLRGAAGQQPQRHRIPLRPGLITSVAG